MEGDIDALERDGGKAALELKRLGFGGGKGCTFADNIYKAGFDIGEGEGFHQGLDIHFLGFEQVRDVCEAIEGSELDRCFSIYLLHQNTGEHSRLRRRHIACWRHYS